MQENDMKCSLGAAAPAFSPLPLGQHVSSIAIDITIHKAAICASFCIFVMAEFYCTAKPALPSLAHIFTLSDV